MSEALMDGVMQALAIVAATFVSEDATCIGTGLLIRTGKVGGIVGVGACTLGIFLGDLGLWLIGRTFGRRALAWRWVRRRLTEERVGRFGQWFDRRGWSAVLAARFLPGTRLPVYLAAGMLGRRAGRFAMWALLAALMWTPALVLAAAWMGDAVVTPVQRLVGRGLLGFAVSLLAIWLALRAALACATPLGRARAWAGLSRIWRWEFWPAWLFYLPVLPWIVWLALRHRGLATPTAANPGIRPHGGVVGESKFAILSKLPGEWVVPSALIEPGTIADRTAALTATMRRGGWSFPIILKPDAGQRGAGVRLVPDEHAVARCLEEHPQPLVAQTYHPGPHEAGIFYYRLPGEPNGRIFSITDKHFPILVGDGVSTVETLIRRHPRFRFQAGTFLARMNGQAGAVLARDARLPLAIAGNHCQGTMFRDGRRLITPALERTIDEIARHFEGFYFGRFDVRYADEEEFMAGRGFAIIELNGVTSESTNLYDPDWPLLRAYAVLFRQWSILFEIGDRNRRAGHSPSRLGQVIADARRYYRERATNLASD